MIHNKNLLPLTSAASSLEEASLVEVVVPARNFVSDSDRLSETLSKRPASSFSVDGEERISAWMDTHRLRLKSSSKIA